MAIYKTIGLIKCYTLEGNYNSGKYVNVLSPRGKESNVRRICTNPPKYTPSIFEEVGKALGPSILDLTDSNPMSRLRNSEFRSLHGLRNSLRNDIERGSIRSESLAKVNFFNYKLPSRFNEHNLTIYFINSQIIFFLSNFPPHNSFFFNHNNILNPKLHNISPSHDISLVKNKRKIKRRIIIIQRKSCRNKQPKIDS